MYPRSLNGHLHAKIPLETLERKAIMARQIAFKLEEYTKKPPKTYKTRSRDEYVKLAKVAQLKAYEMEALTMDLLDLLDLDQLRNHPGDVNPDRHTGFSNARGREPRQLGAIVCVLPGGFAGAVGSLITSATANDVISSRPRVLVQRMDHETYKINQNRNDITGLQSEIVTPLLIFCNMVIV